VRAGRFDHDLRTHFGPGQLGGIALRPDLDLLAIDGDEAVADSDFILQVAQDRVVLEQMARVADWSSR